MTSVNSTYRYGLRMRPPSIGAVPPGFMYEPSPDEGPNTRHGVAVYDRMLSSDEVRQYELVPLSGVDGQPLELPRLPSAVHKQLAEAIEAFLYMQVEILAGNLSRDDCEEHIATMQARLAIFRDWAQRSGVKYDRAIAELGGLPEMFVEDVSGPGEGLARQDEPSRPRMNM